VRLVVFSHSLVSCWNHGNAHFLRGVARELVSRDHDVRIHEPADGWSRHNLVAEHGTAPLEEFRREFPELTSRTYNPRRVDLDELLDGAELVLVHEWNDPDLVRRIGLHRERTNGYRLLFHDTHHRSVTAPEYMQRYDLSHYDGVLAYGKVIRDLYLERGWAQRAWTWHEAADTRLFRPIIGLEPKQGVAWIGNWGDDERTAELKEFLLDPVHDLDLGGSAYGVRYPEEAKQAFARAGMTYHGWIANTAVPRVFARHAVAVHVPRRPYREQLPGIPTIRVFEALACGIPLVSAYWDDAEQLFTPGEDYLVARDGAEMRAHLDAVTTDRALARELVQHGLHTVLTRHTCAHRVDELLAVARSLGVATEPEAARVAEEGRM
jgi:spore maturation protein CgeB